jgi:uncharacterized iron-regulated protein
MAIKNFMTDHPGWFTTSLQEVYGGQEIKVSAGYEMYEFMMWWREWKEIMKNQHPSVQDAVQQVKVVHELSKSQSASNVHMPSMVP